MAEDIKGLRLMGPFEPNRNYVEEDDAIGRICVEKADEKRIQALPWDWKKKVGTFTLRRINVEFMNGDKKTYTINDVDPTAVSDVPQIKGGPLGCSTLVGLVGIVSTAIIALLLI